MLTAALVLVTTLGAAPAPAPTHVLVLATPASPQVEDGAGPGAQVPALAAVTCAAASKSDFLSGSRCLEGAADSATALMLDGSKRTARGKRSQVPWAIGTAWRA